MTEPEKTTSRDDMQQLLEQAERLMKSALRENPLAVVAVAAAAGFIAGLVLARRR